MCGIAGFWTHNQLFNESHLKTMCDSIAHRGPDAEGFFLKDGFGLGHRRLSIIDLSNAANQPMLSSCGRYVIVFNGEIYNYRDISKKFDLQLKTTSDTEVIVELFAKIGKECVHEFNGMFSIVILDTLEQTLHMFRDRMGIKPFYYYLNDKQFLFGSELKTIRSLCNILPLTLNRRAISTFLHVGYMPQPESLFNEVKQFPAGHYGLLSGGELKMSPYWRVEDQIEANTHQNEKQIIKKLDELINSSVAYRMIADVPFGTFLSGGIDSSLVTAVAQSQSAQPINTFSIAFKESKFNEGPYARAVAKVLNTHHHEFIVTENEALELVDSIYTSYDEPFADHSSIATMLVSKLARQHVTMTLSGDGGDELFMGYGMYRWAKRLNNPLVNAFRKPLNWGLSMMSSRYKRIARMFDYSNDEDIRTHIFSQESYYFSKHEINQLLLESSEQSEILSTYQTKRNLSAAESQALFDLKYYLKDDLLVKVDRASMKYALEVRVPLLDYRLVSYALNIDEQLKLHQKDTKIILKKLLYQYLPKELFDRPKWGFGIPLNKWLKGELSYLIDDWLSKEKLEQIGLFDYKAVKQLVNRYRNGETYLYMRIWQLIQVQQTVYRSFIIPKLSF
jgi:asparagine synthase (glutamine-hydrolysing)